MGPDVPPGAVTEDPVRPASAASRVGSRVREYADVVLVAVVFALFVRTFLVQAFVVPTPSMENTVLVGDHLVVNKFVFAPHRWGALLPYRDPRHDQVFVFKFPEDPQRDFIKRVVGLPGDVLEIRNKTVFVNGEERREAWALHSDPRVWPDDRDFPDALRRRDQMPPTRIPGGSYFAMGDNRDSSYDSRFWGPVPAANVKGRALFVYWSLAPPPLSRPGGPFAAFLGFFRRTRWGRCFSVVR
jgi:signal peptidase I